MRYVRHWLETPVSSCIKEWLITPKTNLGYGIPSFANRAEKLQLGKRMSLMQSKHEDIRLLWSDSSVAAIKYDSKMTSSSIAKSLNILSKDQQQKASDHFLALDYQGIVPRNVVQNITKKIIMEWQNVRNTLPNNLFNFLGKAVISQLPSNANLHRWGRMTDPNCPLCSHVQTNKHVLSNCSHPDALLRYTARHDAVLDLLLSWVYSHAKPNWTIFADIQSNHAKPINDLFLNLRPDMAIQIGNKILVLELTVCHESNLITSKSYKLDKYKNINKCRANEFSNCTVSVFTVEVSVLGFISELSDFCFACSIPKLDKETMKKIISNVINYSYGIYNMRNSTK